MTARAPVQFHAFSNSALQTSNTGPDGVKEGDAFDNKMQLVNISGSDMLSLN